MPADRPPIADPALDPAALRAAVRALDPARDDPALWVSIANDDAFAIAHRRTAVLQLVLRHAPPGTTLGRLGALLGGATWLDDHDVRLVEDVGGVIPVGLGPDRTVVSIDVLPGEERVPARVFLALAGDVGRDAAVEALRDRDGAATAEIVERATLPEDGIDAG